MATRSLIAIKNEDNTCTSIYCHYDGYIEGVGRKLKAFWYNERYIRELMALGDISSLGLIIGDKIDYDSKINNDRCIAYGRDWGEEDVAAHVSHSSAYLVYHGGHCGVEYIYLFDNGQWTVCTNFEKRIFNSY